MYEKEFAQRLAQLRTQKGISARDMSLSIGQNPGYINTMVMTDLKKSRLKAGQPHFKKQDNLSDDVDFFTFAWYN